jgi:hypothetical protein
MSVGTITSATNKSTAFEVFITDAGRVEDVAITEEEELRAAGVDGRRWRDVGDRYRFFQAQTITSSSDYAAAIATCREFDGLIGTLCKLSVTLSGVAYAYSRVHVAACSAIAVPGVLSGPGLSDSNTAHVNATWTFVVVEQASGSNP